MKMQKKKSKNLNFFPTKSRIHDADKVECRHSRASSIVSGHSRQSRDKLGTVNDLILFCIHSIVSNSEQCSFERLVKECFTLFPNTVKFPRYPIWPDSRKLDRPLRALRKEKLIIGDPKTYFILTKTGEARAAIVSKALRQGKLL